MASDLTYRDQEGLVHVLKYNFSGGEVWALCGHEGVDVYVRNAPSAVVTCIQCTGHRFAGVSVVNAAAVSKLDFIP